MVKLWAALLVALLAGLTALVAGIVSDARLGTALLRSLICFLGFGCLTFSGIFLFEKLDLGRFLVPFIGEMAKEEGVEAPPEEEASLPADGEMPDEGAAEAGSDDGFVPLSSDDLRRVPI